jgi:hypothetical protein
MKGTKTGRLLVAGLATLFCLQGAFACWLIGFDFCSPVPAGFYGWQTEAFVSGQLPLKMLPDPRLADLSNPYEGSQNAGFRVLDASYFKGRYYSYFGIGPILLLTLPWRLVTHTYLTEPGATAILLLATNAVAAALLLALRKSYFTTISSGVTAAAFALVTIGSFETVHLVGSNAGTVAQMGAYLCLTSALFFLTRALSGQSPVLAVFLCSFSCGSAIACRPSFAPIAAMLVPVVGLIWSRHRGERQVPGLLAAALLPLGAVAAGLLAYNYARFESPWEFGNRFQLTNVDYRSVQLLASTNIRGHVAAFLFAPISLSHYFPFLRNTHDVVPIGLFCLCPASILGVGMLSYLGAAKDQRTKDACAISVGVLISFAGIFLFLAAYLLFLFHYEIDFLYPWCWVACFGWFAVLSDSRVRISATHAISVGGCILCGASAAMAILFTLSGADVSARAPRLTRAINSLVDSLDRHSGVTYGALRLQARFAAEKVVGNWPLVLTGLDHADLVYAKIAADDTVRIGYFHTGLGGPIGEPIKLDLSTDHEIEVAMGSLLPPSAHPFFKSWSDADVIRAKSTLSVKIDGVSALSASVDYYESSPGSIRIGENPHLTDVAASRFPGRISAIVVPFSLPGATDTRAWVGAGGVSFTMKVPPGRVSGLEPILSTGNRGKGDLLFINYLPGSRVTFGLDHWGGAVRSLPVPMEPNEPHTITVVSSALSGPTGRKPFFEVVCDGRSVLCVPIVTYSSDADHVYLGLNAIGSSMADPMFAGTIFNIQTMRPLSKEVRWDSFSKPGTISMRVLFPEIISPAGQPLVTVGKSGMADFVYAVRTDLDHIRFGFDHWGVGGALSDPFAFDPNRRHLIEIYLSSLQAVDGTRPSGDGFEISFDGISVLKGNLKPYPATANTIFVGTNPLGGSTTTSFFQGDIQPLESHP